MSVHAAEEAGSSAEKEYCSLCWVTQTLFTPRGQARRPLKGQKGDGVFLVVANRQREWSQTAIWGGPKTSPANRIGPTSQQDGLQGDAGRLRTQRGQRNLCCTPREWSIPGAPRRPERTFGVGTIVLLTYAHRYSRKKICKKTCPSVCLSHSSTKWSKKRGNFECFRESNPLKSQLWGPRVTLVTCTYHAYAVAYKDLISRPDGRYLLQPWKEDRHSAKIGSKHESYEKWWSCAAVYSVDGSFFKYNNIYMVSTLAVFSSSRKLGGKVLDDVENHVTGFGGAFINTGGFFAAESFWVRTRSR